MADEEKTITVGECACMLRSATHPESGDRLYRIDAAGKVFVFSDTTKPETVGLALKLLAKSIFAPAPIEPEKVEEGK